MKHILRLSLVFLVLVGLLVACGQASDGGGSAPAADAAFKVTGMVDNEMGWTEDEMKAMDTMESESVNKDGEASTYTGVPINTILGEVGVQDGASTVTFVADDGYSADVALDEVRGCADCIISFRNQGGFSVVMPGFPGNVQVKGVIEMQVK
jgi:hypothetical protein